MTPTKVAIVGSCVTREAFITENNPGYKDRYETGALAWQTSIVSLMAPPVPAPSSAAIRPAATMNDHQTKTMLRDIAKQDRVEIEEYRPDLLIFDLYSDVRYGYVELAGTQITNNPNGFRKTEFAKSLDAARARHLARHRDEYLRMFQERFGDFVDWARAALPEATLVLNAFRFSSHFTRNGEDLNFVRYTGETNDDNKWRRVLQENDVLDGLYRWVSDVHAPKVIDNRHRSYAGNGHHRYGVTPWHFGQPFFADFLSRLNEIDADRRRVRALDREPDADRSGPRAFRVFGR